MSKTTEIREICGDYALDVEYSADFTFTMFFNSRRNAETVKRCIEVDDSVPNVATAVDFVEVVRCKDCEHWKDTSLDTETEDHWGECRRPLGDYRYSETSENDFCSYGERSEAQNG